MKSFKSEDVLKCPLCPQALYAMEFQKISFGDRSTRIILPDAALTFENDREANVRILIV